MTYSFQATRASDGRTLVTDHETADEAARAVEAVGAGSVVKFNLRPNLPGLLPVVVRESLSMWICDGGKWFKLAIFTDGGRIGEERPGSNAIELRRLADNPFVTEVLTPHGYWNSLGRFPTSRKATAETRRLLKILPGREVRVRDERVKA